jgi:hypothetical protein
MSRRKSEITGYMNERDFPHVVELVLPPEGFRSVLLEIDAFHRERRIPVRRGRSRHEAEQFYIRFCFPDTATADCIPQSLRRRMLDLSGKSDAPAVKREAEEEWGKKKWR